MATQYTSILKLALPVQGELDGTWGDVVNDNITSMVEEAIAGRATINTWTANSHTLTTADGTTSESRAAILTLTDTGTSLTGAGTVVCPAASKIYIVENGTGQTITVKTSSGTGVAIPDGKNMVVFCDGTNVEEGITNINSLTISGDTTISGTASFSGDVAVDTDTLFVDVSANAVGIGEASPQQELHITSANPTVRVEDSDGTDTFGDFGFNGSAILIDARNGSSDGAILFRGLGGGTATEYARFNSNGNLGLGVSSPGALLHLGTAGPQIRFEDTDATGTCRIFQAGASFTFQADPSDVDANSKFVFSVDGTEKFRVDDAKIVAFCGSEIEHTAVTSSSNAATIDLDDGDSFTHDLTENVTYTFSNPAPSGKATAFILKVIQDSTARTITWPSSVDWSGGTAPTLSTGNNDVDIFVFYTNDGGTTYYGSIVGQDFA